MKKDIIQRAEKIIEAAKRNAIERQKLIKDTKELVKADAKLWNTCLDVDKNFLRKVLRYAGDITTHRLATTLSKAIKS